MTAGAVTTEPRARHRHRDRVRRGRARRLGQDHLRHREGPERRETGSAAARCARTSASATTACGSTRTGSITGAIRAKYDGLGCSPGLPRSRAGLGGAAATRQKFEDGTIYSRDGPGAHSCTAWSSGRYLDAGGPAGDLGFPTTDVRGWRTGTSGRGSSTASSPATPTTRAAPSPSPAATTSGTAGRAARAAPPARPCPSVGVDERRRDRGRLVRRDRGGAHPPRVPREERERLSSGSVGYGAMITRLSSGRSSPAGRRLRAARPRRWGGSRRSRTRARGCGPLASRGPGPVDVRVRGRAGEASCGPAAAGRIGVVERLARREVVPRRVRDDRLLEVAAPRGPRRRTRRGRDLPGPRRPEEEQPAEREERPRSPRTGRRPRAGARRAWRSRARGGGRGLRARDAIPRRRIPPAAESRRVGACASSPTRRR